MSTPRRSLPHSKKVSGFSLPGHALSEGQPQRHSVAKTISRNSSTYKYNMSGTQMRSQKRTNSKSIRLSDLMAAMYPGLKIGHKNCVEKVIFVPKTMGWLWNTEDTATGVPFPRGWRPGAIALGVRRNVRSRLMSEPLTTPTGSKGKKAKKKGGRADAPSTTKKTKSCISSIAIDVPPTLCIQKENGVYHVKMRPIKKGGDDENIEEEQPVQFKIADSISSQQSKSSSSSLKIEYLCTGALRKPIKKPELAEMGTQWETADFEKKEPVPEKSENEEKKVQKKGKKKKSSVKEQPLN